MATQHYFGHEYDDNGKTFNEEELNVTLDVGSISTRFDLEQQMLACWQITDDLEVIYDNIMGDDSLTKNDIADLLLGLQKLYTMKFQKQSLVFDELLQTGDIR